ncbi:hypothetical protein CRG98_000533 [Punica granatum]|uniref:Uncharacterized protein n=1 Tax=Punica granatum TaxID=22663 RepID=A0A2I0LEE8_PUNGR|nr:hypothetical protein CRG98_000533 [Punica granatum]
MAKKKKEKREACEVGEEIFESSGSEEEDVIGGSGGGGHDKSMAGARAGEQEVDLDPVYERSGKPRSRVLFVFFMLKKMNSAFCFLNYI